MCSDARFYKSHVQDVGVDYAANGNCNFISLDEAPEAAVLEVIKGVIAGGAVMSNICHTYVKRCN